MGSRLTDGEVAGLDHWNNSSERARQGVYVYVLGLSLERPSKQDILLLDRAGQELLVTMAYYFGSDVGRFLLTVQDQYVRPEQLIQVNWWSKPNFERPIFRAGDKIKVIAVPRANGPLSGSVKIVVLDDEIGIPYCLLCSDDQQFVEQDLSAQRLRA